MGDLGPVNFGPQIDLNDWGKAWMEPSKVSDQMQSRVDEEIKKIVNAAHERAKLIITKNRKKLDQLAAKLLEKESLDEKEFEELMK